MPDMPFAAAFASLDTRDHFLALAERQVATPRKRRLASLEAREERRREQQKKLAEGQRMERRAAFLARHGDGASELLECLAAFTPGRAPDLLAIIDRRLADRDTRFEVIALIDERLIELRESAGLPPFDDPLPSDPPGVFELCQETLHP
jgi:hypothetical protein